jgi:hypothetical protein
MRLSVVLYFRSYNNRCFSRVLFFFLSWFFSAFRNSWLEFKKHAIIVNWGNKISLSWSLFSHKNAKYIRCW